MAVEPIKIRSFGGDGIGQGARDCTNTLELRHYRDGAVRARVHMHAWHQNGSYSGAGDWYSNADIVLTCQSVEAVIVNLKNISVDETRAYSDSCEEELAETLEGLGLLEAEPAPDEADAA